MSDYQNNQGLAMDEIEPDYKGTQPPQTLTQSRHIHGVFWLAGRSPVENKSEYDVMFVTTAVEEEECARARKSTFGFSVQVPPEYLKGPSGVLKDVALRAGLDIDQSYYTALVKWLLPRTKRPRPPVAVLKYGLPVLMDEIKRVKPKVIVCLGKLVFDMLAPKKIGFNDAHGGWFWSEEAQAHLYVMYSPWNLVARPEMYETFRVDFREVRRKLDLINEVGTAVIPTRWEVIRDEQSLRDWVDKMKRLDPWPGHRDQNGNKLLAVDGEWHGRQHVDGQLRMIQFAWSESDAVVIEFRNEKNEFSFELDDGGGYDEVSDAAYAVARTRGVDPDAGGKEWDAIVERQKYAYIGRIIGEFVDAAPRRVAAEVAANKEKSKQL